MSKIIFSVLILIPILFTEVNAQVYRYTDKEGNSVYTDSSTKADGQKDSSKISDATIGTRTEPDKDRCYPPRPTGIASGSGGGSALGYDYDEVTAYQECLKRGGKKVPRTKNK